MKRSLQRNTPANQQLTEKSYWLQVDVSERCLGFKHEYFLVLDRLFSMKR